MPIKRTRRRKGTSRPRRPHIAVVSSLRDARAALAVAREAGRGAILVSPPGAVAYLGVGFFAALIDAARAEFPEIAIEAVMDCGDDPGHALAALRMGFKQIILRGNPKARARVAAIARGIGARLLVRPPKASRPRGEG